MYQMGGQVVFSKIRWVFTSKGGGCEFFSFSIITESLHCINFNDEWVARWGGEEPGCLYCMGMCNCNLVFQKNNKKHV